MRLSHDDSSPCRWYASHMRNDPIKILVVDDLARSRQSIMALLAAWQVSAELREAANGREAVALATAWQPDAVVMDIRMPDMDGLEAAQIIKANWPGIRVVILSLYSDYEAQARAAGADAFVTKGEPPAHLLAALDAIAGRDVE